MGSPKAREALIACLAPSRPAFTSIAVCFASDMNTGFPALRTAGDFVKVFEVSFFEVVFSFSLLIPPGFQIYE